MEPYIGDKRHNLSVRTYPDEYAEIIQREFQHILRVGDAFDNLYPSPKHCQKFL